MEKYLTGKYVDKKQALHLLASMNVNWTRRQIDWTAEPDITGNRRWPWFIDAKGVLRIDGGFIREQFESKQIQSLKKWKNNAFNI